MKNNFHVTEFFLGANTPCGFFSIFDKLYFPESGWYCNILKGGPGTGKSTLMKKISKKAEKKKINHELIRCSSDPKSLDAVILNELKKCFVDGTSPHVIDPVYPGVSDEIINLGDYWDSELLKSSKNEIISLCKENKNFHKMSQRYLAAFGYAFNSIERIIEENIDYEKLETFCKKISKKIVRKNLGEKSYEKTRFLTSITPDGYICLSNSINSLCEKIIILDDKYSIVGSYIINYIKKQALKANKSIISCISPFSPTKCLDALFIPSDKIGVIVKNQFLHSDFLTGIKVKIEKIYTKRFIKLKHKNIIDFNSKICKEFLKESVINLSNARKVHDKIEKLYSSSMNYSKINKITQKLSRF